jgi:dTDP-4-dehydrorhamnose 3,5-epimerase-like enzyme
MVITGTALVAAVEMTDTKKPDKDKEVHRFVLSAGSPSILVVPAGYVNGFKTLSADAVLLIFSSSTLEDSQGDDYRFPYDYWNPWQIEPR